MKRSNGIEFLKVSIKKVLKKYGKLFFKMGGNPVISIESQLYQEYYSLLVLVSMFALLTYTLRIISGCQKPTRTVGSFHL